jgi:hypothetical protein
MSEFTSYVWIVLNWFDKLLEPCALVLTQYMNEEYSVDLHYSWVWASFWESLIQLKRHRAELLAHTTHTRGSLSEHIERLRPIPEDV